jgi:Tol biopolymer transport system component
VGSVLFPGTNHYNYLLHGEQTGILGHRIFCAYSCPRCPTIPCLQFYKEPFYVQVAANPQLTRTPYPFPWFTADVFLQALTREGQAQGNPQQLTHSGIRLTGLAWHRDGTSIIFGAMPTDSLFRLYQLSLAGGDPERIEIAGLGAQNPSTSPSSDRLAFSYSMVDHDIWRVSPGGTPEPLIRSSLSDRSPDFSPDGSRVAFTSNRNGESNEIWITNADGNNPVQLTHGPGRNQGTGRWSPDGRWLAFDSEDAKGQYDIYVISSDGGQPRRITTGPSNKNNPSWSRNGAWIYFNSDRTGRREVWRAPFVGGDSEQVTHAGGMLAWESTNGKTLFYTKQGGNGTFAQPLDGGPEEKLLETGGWLAIVESGFYYRAPQGSDGLWPLMFFYLSSRKSSQIARITTASLEQGFAVSPDGKTLLYSASLTSRAFDLRLIEHFR